MLVFQDICSSKTPSAAPKASVHRGSPIVEVEKSLLITKFFRIHPKFDWQSLDFSAPVYVGCSLLIYDEMKQSLGMELLAWLESCVKHCLEKWTVGTWDLTFIRGTRRTSKEAVQTTKKYTRHCIVSFFREPRRDDISSHAVANSVKPNLLEPI